METKTAPVTDIIVVVGELLVNCFSVSHLFFVHSSSVKSFKSAFVWDSARVAHGRSNVQITSRTRSDDKYDVNNCRVVIRVIFYNLYFIHFKKKKKKFTFYRFQTVLLWLLLGGSSTSDPLQ